MEAISQCDRKAGGGVGGGRQRGSVEAATVAAGALKEPQSSAADRDQRQLLFRRLLKS